MKSRDKSREERLRSAAIVKLKYQILTGHMDSGFQVVYGGILKELSLGEGEVDSYIAKNQKELLKICKDQN